MKRKFADGAALLTKIIKHNHPLIQEYVGNCYTFRGYAYAAQEMHEKASRDLSAASKVQKLDSASEYNFLVSQAIINFEKKPDIALSQLAKAKNLYSKNPEPFVYESCIYFSMKLTEKSKESINKALELKAEDSDLHYFRAIMNYYENKHPEGVSDVEIAIEKAEDNNAYHYLLRGLCYAQLGLYNEAINDFSAVLQLDENLSQAYLYRGRCAFIQEDTNLAYADFQKLLYAKPEDPVVHAHAGDLLLLTQCTEDAIKAYNNSLSKGKTKQPYIQKAKCYLILGNYKEAIREISEALVIETDKKLLQDLNVLKALELCVDNNFSEALEVFQEFTSDGAVIKLRDIRKYIGLCFFFIEEYQFAQSIYQNLLETQDQDTIEVLYNLALSNIMAEYYEAALTQLSELAYLVDGCDRGKILLLTGFIQLGLDSNSQGKQYLSEAYKYDPSTVTAYLKQSSETSVLALNSSDGFASEFPLVNVSIGQSSSIFIRPSFTLPAIELPNIEFETDEIFLTQFSLKSIKCKPEAPWLNRVQGMIQFTDEIQDILSETVTESVAEDEEVQQDVFEEGTENFKKYRSALCLPRGQSDDMLKNMQAVFHNNNEDGSFEF